MLWCFFIVVTPLLAHLNYKFTSGFIYLFFSKICHQELERSFSILGKQFAVCVRCTGIYSGFLISTILYPIIQKRGKALIPDIRYFIFAIIPVSIDFSLGFFNIWQNTFISRFVTGITFGSIIAFFIIPGLLNLTNNNGGNHGRKTR